MTIEVLRGIEEFLKGNELAFSATVDLAKLNAFRKIHDPHIAEKSLDPIFMRTYAIEYKPSTCGNSVHIICECKEREDITDYSNW